MTTSTYNKCGVFQAQLRENVAAWYGLPKEFYLSFPLNEWFIVLDRYQNEISDMYQNIRQIEKHFGLTGDSLLITPCAEWKDKYYSWRKYNDRENGHTSR